MSILSDADLHRLVRFNKRKWQQKREILIENGSVDFFTPMGYDLRVGGFYKTLVAKPNIRPIEKDAVIQPGDIALVSTYEMIRMPKNGLISALIVSKVSIVAKGLSNVSTKVDPGWQGCELLIPVQNFSKNPIKLEYGEPFCTIVFMRNMSPSQKQYDSSGGKTKFIKLLAETRRKSFLKEILLESIPLLTIGIALLIPHLTEIKVTDAVIVGATISPFIKYFTQKITSKEK